MAQRKDYPRSMMSLSEREHREEIERLSRVLDNAIMSQLYMSPTIGTTISDKYDETLTVEKLNELFEQFAPNCEIRTSEYVEEGMLLFMDTWTENTLDRSGCRYLLVGRKDVLSSHGIYPGKIKLSDDEIAVLQRRR